MTAAKKFATQEQHERLSVRVEVISHDTTRLTRDVAEIREEMNERFDAVDRELAKTREEILKVVNDGHAALLSAIMQLGKQ